MNYEDKVRYLTVVIKGSLIRSVGKRANINISLKSQKILIEYVKDILSTELSEKTLKTRVLILKRLCYELKKDFDEMTKADLKEFLNKKEYKPNTLNLVKSILKLFFRWYYKVEEKGKYPPIVDWIELKFIYPQELSKDELISWDEAKMLTSSAMNFRDKCLIMLLRETGARINELLAINIGDVRFENNSAYVKVFNSKRRSNEKTHRTNLLIESYYYLYHYLQNHPLKGNKEAPLFVMRNNKRMNHNSVMKVLNTIKKRTNFKKRLNPHTFRHSQASDMSQLLTDAEMRVMFGWARNSMMSSRYTHIKSDEVNNKLLELRGRKQPTESSISIKENLQPCPRCKEMMDIDKNRFCGKCGMDLHGEEAIKEHIKMERFEEEIDKYKKKLKEKIKKEILEELKKK